MALAPLGGVAAAAPAAPAQWSEPQELCSACGTAPNGSPLAVAPNGDALATWAGGAAIRQGRGRFGARTALENSGQLAAIGADGTAAIAGRFIGPDRSIQTAVRVRPADRGWGPSEAFPIRLPGIAVDDDGAVSLVGNELGPARAYQVTWRVRSPGGEWSPGRAISAAPAGSQTADPRLVAGPRGDLLAAWVESGLSPKRLVTAVRGPDGEWGQPERLAPAALPVHSVRALALDGAGNALAIFQRPPTRTS